MMGCCLNIIYKYNIKCMLRQLIKWKLGNWIDMDKQICQENCDIKIKRW